MCGSRSSWYKFFAKAQVLHKLQPTKKQKPAFTPHAQGQSSFRQLNHLGLVRQIVQSPQSQTLI